MLFEDTRVVTQCYPPRNTCVKGSRCVGALNVQLVRYTRPGVVLGGGQRGSIRSDVGAVQGGC